MDHPRCGFAAPPPGGDAGGPAEPDPLRLLGRGGSTATSRVLLCAASEVPEGGARGLPALGIFVVRYQGRVHGWRDACPHYGDTPLAWKRDAYLSADGTRIVCASHGAQFEPDTGLCTLGPCVGQSLTRVPVTRVANGDLFLFQEMNP